MRIHDKPDLINTHIDEKKVGVCIFGKRVATYCVCVYVRLAVCLSKQLGIAQAAELFYFSVSCGLN